MRRTDLTADELSVLHAMQDMDRAGVYPSGGRLVDALPETPAPAVRGARRDLLASGLMVPATPDDGCDGDDATGGDAAPETRRYVAAPKVDTEAREYNVALYRIVQGETGVYRHLSVITGMSPNALKLRVSRVRHEYPPEDLEPDADGLSASDLRYYEHYLAKHNDPAVREWLMSHSPARRAHPDRCRFRDGDAEKIPA